MPSPLPQLPLAAYRFRFQAETEIQLPADPRGLWHGVFGLRLRELVCLFPGTECHACTLLHQCPYSHLFSGPRPPQAELMRRYDTIPVPHAFQHPAEAPEAVRPGGSIDVNLVLIGDANDHLPLVVHSLAAAGRGGLGRDRRPVWLQEVTQSLPDETAPLVVASKGRLHPAQPPRTPATPPPPAVVRMRFLAPYKASGQATKGDEFDLGRLLMALVRRISLLQYFYTGARLEAPFSSLKAAAESARPRDQRLRHQDASRYAARHGERLNTGGLVGSIDLDLTGIEPLWPFLYLGQWLNVGKNASMGYGHYVLTSILAAP